MAHSLILQYHKSTPSSTSWHDGSATRMGCFQSPVRSIKTMRPFTMAQTSGDRPTPQPDRRARKPPRLRSAWCPSASRNRRLWCSAARAPAQSSPPAGSWCLGPRRGGLRVPESGGRMRKEHRTRGFKKMHIQKVYIKASTRRICLHDGFSHQPTTGWWLQNLSMFMLPVLLWYAMKMMKEFIYLESTSSYLAFHGYRIYKYHLKHLFACLFRSCPEVQVKWCLE